MERPTPFQRHLYRDRPDHDIFTGSHLLISTIPRENEIRLKIMIDFRVFLSALFLFIAVLVNIITFKSFVFISLSILCIAVLFEKWSTNGLRAVEKRQKKRKNNEQLPVSNGMFSNMFFNRSFQDKSKADKNNTSSTSTWRIGATSPHVPTDNRIRNRSTVSRNHSFSGRRSDFNASRITDSHLKYIPFLPTVRRALGLDNVPKRYSTVFLRMIMILCCMVLPLEHSILKKRISHIFIDVFLCLSMSICLSLVKVFKLCLCPLNTVRNPVLYTQCSSAERYSLPQQIS